uniref:Putative secreted protein n=1 Tax=Anopheles triannulatus TaxID=58253 RepID=A0A2M4B3V5_9DIPT
MVLSLSLFLSLLRTLCRSYLRAGSGPVCPDLGQFFLDSFIEFAWASRGDSKDLRRPSRHHLTETAPRGLHYVFPQQQDRPVVL